MLVLGCVRRLAPIITRIHWHSRRPFSSTPPPSSSPSLSDSEWEIRTGRAIFILQTTLPDFFQTGLLTSVDTKTGTGTVQPASAVAAAIKKDENDHIEPIYSPKIRLSYTPPTALPAPFPKTLHVEGLPLYLASSVFVRHTLNTLYSNIDVSFRKLVVHTPAGTAAIENLPAEGGDSSKYKKRKSREKCVLVSLSVTGTSRVTGHPAEWDVASTYTFSPITGLILTHTVDSIHPAPHQAVYDALRLSLGKVFGLGLEGTNGARPGTVTISKCDSQQAAVKKPSSLVPGTCGG